MESAIIHCSLATTPAGGDVEDLVSITAKGKSLRHGAAAIAPDLSTVR
jgi:hypothetical protein